MSTERSQRNTESQELETVRARLKENQRLLKTGKAQDSKRRSVILRQIARDSKRIDDLRAVSAVDKGIKEAG